MYVPTSGIERLHHFVTERRMALGISRRELFARGGPSPSTMNKALTGDRAVSRVTLDRLDRGLGWAPGSAQSVYDGGEPTTALTLNATGCGAHGHAAAVLQTIGDELHRLGGLVASLLGGDIHDGC